ncbi:MAG: F0F1 ATP synthase subunit epsilon [Candidatus Azobacteroides sp.]|nr:F0F1 ATP synthase subunit epsilon [Candidatus Azobacteroides sp.]
MKLNIISPEKILFSGEVSSVTLPGAMGSFTILKDHAPIISKLGEGTITYSFDGNEVSLPVKDGFIEAKRNIVTVCVE